MAYVTIHFTMCNGQIEVLAANRFRAELRLFRQTLASTICTTIISNRATAANLWHDGDSVRMTTDNGWIYVRHRSIDRCTHNAFTASSAAVTTSAPSVSRINLWLQWPHYGRESEIELQLFQHSYSTTAFLVMGHNLPTMLVSMLVSWQGKAIGRVRLSVRPSVCFHSTYEPTHLWTWFFLCAWAMTLARRRLIVKGVKGFRVSVK